MSLTSRLAILALGPLIAVPLLHGVPVDSGSGNTISDRKSFIPNRKNVVLPGKVIGVLVSDAQPVLSLEGRSGPADQICLGYNGGSYRWLYVQVEKDAMIPWLNLPVGPTGAEKKRFENLSLANAANLKSLGVDSKYALVEIDVNGRLGGPADDSCVASKIKVLDGSAEFPLKVEEVIADLAKRYKDQQDQMSREINVGMEKAAAAALKDQKAPGNRQRSEIMFVTWMPETERLRIHFRTTISDGAQPMTPGNFGPRAMQTMARRPIATARSEPTSSPSIPVQFGVEFGVAYEVSKSGKLERTLTLPLETFQREFKGSPGMIGDGGGARTMMARPGSALKGPIPPPPQKP